MEKWQPNLEDENEPQMHLNIPGGEFLAHRGNTRLYTHLGRLAMYDHVFCSGEEQRGFYIFSVIDGFDQLKEYMLATNYPAFLNQTEVAQCDIDAYDNMIQKSLGDLDHIPDDWA